MENKYNYEIDGETTYIHLIYKKTIVVTTIIDTKNLNKFLNFKYTWHPNKRAKREDYYIKATIYNGTINGKRSYGSIFLHLYLLNREYNKDIEVDHINGDSIDNREINLRVSSHSENDRNRKSKNSNNKTGIRNMCWIEGYMRLQLQKDGKNYRFPEKFTADQFEEAKNFADEMRKEFYGEYAGKN